MRSVALVGLFAAFLYPIGVGELSINYIFVLYPLFLLLYDGRVMRPPDAMVLGAILFLLIFLASILYYIQLPDLVIRRIASFLVFMSLFSYSIVRVQPHMVVAFKRAVILMSVYFSVIAIVGFLDLTAVGLVSAEAKNVVGSQRYGFIYILGFWLVLFSLTESAGHRVRSCLFLVIITCGLFLTFSRSSIVALAGSLFIYVMTRVGRAVWWPRLGTLSTLALSCAGIVFVISVVYYQFPETIKYYDEALFGPVRDGRLVEAANDPRSSEGMRIVRVAESMAYVLRNPVIGTGYLGIWSISESGAGSTHSQLLDTFIRVGVVGFMFYIYLILRLARFLARFDSPLFWGLIGILIYGLFHETFKESQGAFVLAVLFGMFSQYVRDRRRGLVFDHWPVSVVSRKGPYDTGQA